MPFVARNRNNEIIAAFKDENECAPEEIGPNDPELRAFLGQAAAPAVTRQQAVGCLQACQHLHYSDMGFIRVLDDLISAMLNKGMIVFTDLPPVAQRKLMQRGNLRDKARQFGGLVGESQEIRASS